MEKIIKHIAFTWLLMQGIHLLLWKLFFLQRFGLDGEDALFAFLAFLFSIPACLLCLLLIKPVIDLKVNAIFKFFIWMFTAASSVVVTAFVIAVLLGGGGEFFRLIVLLLPACVSAVLAMLIRYKQFFRLTNQTNDK